MIGWFHKSTLESGLGLETPKIDPNQIAHNEEYTCLTCHHTGALTTKGRCAVCNSDAVLTTRMWEGTSCDPQEK